MVRVLTIMLFFILTSCADNYMCDTYRAPGVNLTLKIEGDQPLYGKIQAVAFENDYLDTLRGYYDLDSTYLSLNGLHERSGTYSLLVVSEHYTPISKTDIVVHDGECHVNTVHLDLVLQPK